MLTPGVRVTSSSLDSGIYSDIFFNHFIVDITYIHTYIHVLPVDQVCK